MFDQGHESARCPALGSCRGGTLTDKGGFLNNIKSTGRFTSLMAKVRNYFFVIQYRVKMINLVPVDDNLEIASEKNSIAVLGIANKRWILTEPLFQLFKRIWPTRSTNRYFNLLESVPYSEKLMGRLQPRQVPDLITLESGDLVVLMELL